MIKVLLYCEEAKRNEELLCPIYDPLDGKPTWVFGHKDIPPINGLICFECDMNEIFVEDWGRKDRIKVTNQETTMDLSYNVNDIVGLMMDIESQIGISNEELVKYVGNGKEFTDLFYVYHLENIHQIDPNAILYKNKKLTKQLYNAPKNYCFAYRKNYFAKTSDEALKKIPENDITTDYEFDENGYFVVEKVLVFPVKPLELYSYITGKTNLKVKKNLIFITNVNCL
jgi:hypothetical protein